MFYRTSPAAASEGFRFLACNFIKKVLRKRFFFCEFCKTFKNIFSFDKTPPDGCFLCLSVNFEMFSELLLQSTSGKLLFGVQVAEFQPPDTVKNYFTGAFQAFYIRSRGSHSKAFIYIKFLKTVCEEVNLLWSCEMPTSRVTCNLLVHPSQLSSYWIMA